MPVFIAPLSLCPNHALNSGFDFWRDWLSWQTGRDLAPLLVRNGHFLARKRPEAGPNDIAGIAIKTGPKPPVNGRS